MKSDFSFPREMLLNNMLKDVIFAAQSPFFSVCPIFWWEKYQSDGFCLLSFSHQVMLLTFSFFLCCAAENRCLGLGSKTPNYMSPVQPGLYQLIPPTELPPAEAPNPLLTESEVVEAPLPPVAILAPPPGDGSNQATSPTKSNAQLEVVSSVVPSFLAFLVATLALF